MSVLQKRKIKDQLAPDDIIYDPPRDVDQSRALVVQLGWEYHESLAVICFPLPPTSSVSLKQPPGFAEQGFKIF